MGATYTRQSSYTDGDVITAAHTNDEFNQLLAAFASSSGHTHDGTSAEGGPITKLLGNTLTFGAGTAGTDITITFDGETNDGVLKWMEDEDYFEFSDDILVASTEKLQFRDTAIYINSSTDGQLDLVADTEIQIAATTVDINGNVDISGTLTIGSAGISETELEVLDGLTVTTTEVNILDGDTTASSTTLADADRVVVNDAGTMKQVALTDFETYFESALDTLSNVTTVGALNSGSITSGFGTIDTGSSTITTTGLITGGSLDIDDVLINGSNIGHTDDTDLITVANGLVTVAGEISVTTLDIGGTNVTSTATELNLLDGVSGLVQADFTKLAAVDATATELNIMDGDTSATSTTLADADRVVVNDAGTMKQVALTDFETYFESALDTLSNVTTVGALNSGSITSGFGTIDTGSSTITTTGLITGGSLDIDDVLINGTTIGHTDDTDLITLSNGVVTVAGEVDAVSLDVSGGIDVDGTTDLDNTDIDGTLVVDGSNISLDSTSTLNIDNSNTSNGITIGTATSGVPISIGHTTSEVTVNDNLTVTGDLTVSGTTTTVNSTTVNLNDHNIVLDTGNTTSAVINGAGITIEGGSGDDATFTYNTTGPQFELKLGSSFEDLQTAKLTATELDISGDADIDGTLEADAITVNGTALNTVIAGVTVANATTAAVATTVTISDNESTNEDNAIIFTSGGDVDGGNIGLESDGDLTYNPSTGRLTATQLSGTLQTAAQGNVTSLGTLTTLTVDNVIINGSTIGHTGDTDLMTVASGVLTVAGEVDATSLDISGDADIDGTLEADAITVNGTALNTVIADESTALAIALG
jgi:cytoskeletal protein CcmA (bactofilin family)